MSINQGYHQSWSLPLCLPPCWPVSKRSLHICSHSASWSTKMCITSKTVPSTRWRMLMIAHWMFMSCQRSSQRSSIRSNWNITQTANCPCRSSNAVVIPSGVGPWYNGKALLTGKSEGFIQVVTGRMRIGRVASLFGMPIRTMSWGMEVSLRTTTRSTLNTHIVSWWLLNTNRDQPLILLRHSNQFDIILYPDDIWDRTSASHLDILRQVLRNWWPDDP